MSTNLKRLLSSSSIIALQLTVTAGGASLGLLSVPSHVLAACVTQGSITSCGTSAPNPWGQLIGTGSGDNNRTVIVESGASVSVGDGSAISLGDGADITLQEGSLVTSNNVTNRYGKYSAGNNTIEFNNRGRLVIGENARLIQSGTANNTEPVNVIGAGNQIINRGYIESNNNAAIWFQDRTRGARNSIDNYGTIRRVGGGPVIGSNGGAGIDFTNRTGARVEGSLAFGSGNDNLTFEAGSIVTGSINGGGGTNRLFLQGVAGSEDSIAGALANFESLTKSGEGKWTVSGRLTGFKTVTVDQGTLALSGDNTNYDGSIAVNQQGILEATAQSLPESTDPARNIGNVRNDGLVRFIQNNNADYTGQITGSGRVEKMGTGTLILGPNGGQGNLYSGGTTINEGTIAIAVDRALGDAAGSLVLNGGALRFDQSFALSNQRRVSLQERGGTFDTNGNNGTINQAINGAGDLTKIGSGNLILSGNNDYQGVTNVLSGGLFVNGDQSAATGDTNISSGAQISGTGTIGGNVNIADGGILAPGPITDEVSTLTINGDLNLAPGAKLDYHFGQANVVGGPLNDHTIVRGDLSLDGTIDVNTPSGGTFDEGVYRIISYDGTLTNNGLAIGQIPSQDVFVQTAVDKQVNLVNAGDQALNFWDVSPPSEGSVGNGQVNGGTGTWQAQAFGDNNINWTNADGSVNAPYQDDAFAVFMATAGTVTVDASLGDIRSGGMQFASDGYLLRGDPIVLTGGDTTTIRVGDGSSAGADFTATIDSTLTGDTRLRKTDAGTLVLNGNNSYTGGTSIEGGRLSISNDVNLGAANTDININNGILRTTADMTTSRQTTVGPQGATLEVAEGTTFYHDGIFDGSGVLRKSDAGTLVLSGDNSYAGGTIIDGGTLQIFADRNLGQADSGLLINGGTLRTTEDINMARATGLGPNGGTFETLEGTKLQQAGQISGEGQLIKAGLGHMTLTADNNYSGGTRIQEGTLELGNGGTTGSINGDVDNSGTMIFNRSNAVRFEGSVSGTGNLIHRGTGLTEFTSQSSYSGETTVENGIFAAGAANALSGNSDFTVNSQATVALNDYNQTMKSLTNDGLIHFGGTAGTVLSVLGDYSTQGGVLHIHSVLGDDRSTTDLLTVAGDSNGKGLIKVTNAGGSGAQTREGIKIVDITGQSNAQFDLLGDFMFNDRQAVVGGAYAYQLYQNGVSTPTDGDWYLRSQRINDEPLYQPGIPSYEAYPEILHALNSLPTLQQRVGNRNWVTQIPSTTPKDQPGLQRDGFWVRVEGSNSKVTPVITTAGTNYDLNTYEVQAGYDALLADTAQGAFIGGVFASYGNGKAKTEFFGDEFLNYADGQIDTNSYGLAASLTWYGNNGFYADAQAHARWFSSDLKLRQGGTLTSSNDGYGLAASLEMGRQIEIAPSWTLTPQAQLVYSHVDFDQFTDQYGAGVSLTDGNRLEGRLGISLDYQERWTDANGLEQSSHLYGIVNLYRDFSDGSQVDVSGTSLHSQAEKTNIGFGIGGTYTWDNSKYAIYGEASVKTGLSDFGDSYRLKGMAGFKVKF